jgi:excisionase family DNA binding protein
MEIKVDLDHQDLVQQITQEVIRGLKPLLSGHGDSDKIKTAYEVATYLRLSRDQVYLMVARNEIPYTRIGDGKKGRKMFIKSNIDKWLDAKTVRPITPLKLLRSKRPADC